MTEQALGDQKFYPLRLFLIDKSMIKGPKTFFLRAPIVIKSAAQNDYKADRDFLEYDIQRGFTRLST